MKRLILLLIPYLSFAQSGYDLKPVKTWFKDTVLITKQLKVNSQGGAIIGGYNKNDDAILELSSTTRTFLPPRMTAVQRLAISSPTNGAVVFDTDSGELCFYNSGWNCIEESSGGGGANPYFQNGLSNLNDSTGELGGPLLHNTDVTFNTTVHTLTFGDAGVAGYLNFGNVNSDGNTQLTAITDRTQFKAFDGATDVYGKIQAEGTAINANAPNVQMNRSDDVNYDYGFTAFDEILANKRHSNIYYYGIPTGNDLMRIGVTYKTNDSTDSYIEGHIHTDFSDANSSLNGWLATYNHSCLHYNSSSFPDFEDGYNWKLNNRGITATLLNVQHFNIDTGEITAITTVGEIVYEWGTDTIYIPGIQSLEFGNYSKVSIDSLQCGIGIATLNGNPKFGGWAIDTLTGESVLFAFQKESFAVSSVSATGDTASLVVSGGGIAATVTNAFEIGNENSGEVIVVVDATPGSGSVTIGATNDSTHTVSINAADSIMLNAPTKFLNLDSASFYALNYGAGITIYCTDCTPVDNSAGGVLVTRNSASLWKRHW